MLPYNLTPDLVIVQVKSLSALRQLAQRHTDSEKQSQKMSSSFCGPRTGCLSAVLLGLIDPQILHLPNGILSFLIGKMTED